MEIYLNEIKHHPEYEFYKHYKKIQYLASGSFGNVIRAINIETKQELAVKIVNKRELNNIVLIKKEINILKQLNHKNIVQFLGYVETRYNFYILMELIRGVTLRNLISSSDNLTEKDFSLIMKNLFEAVKYLHDKDIIHRDIKLENIMINKRNLSSLKLIDFGLSSIEYEDAKLHDLCGTWKYMAPEQVDKKAYCKEVDIWSCGIVMYMLLNKGEHPFIGIATNDYLNRLNELQQTSNLSSLAWNLIRKLLEPNPSHRYSTVQALKHPWITGNLDDDIPKTFFEKWKTHLLKKRFTKVSDLFNILVIPCFLVLITLQEDRTDRT